MAKKKKTPKRKTQKRKKASKKKGRRPLPIWLSFIACDHVITDILTKNRTVVGVFNDILSSKFPAVHPKMGLYVELTNGHGQVQITFRLVDAETDKVLFSASGGIDFADPRQVANLNISVNNIVFPREGEYRWQLLADGELLVERRIVAKLVKSSKGEQDESQAKE